MTTSRTFAIAALAATFAAPLTAQETEPEIDIYFGSRPSEFKVAKWGPDSFPTPHYAFRAEKIVPVDGPPIQDGVVITKDKKIVAIGKASEITIPEGCEVLDFGESWIMPGLVDLHCHVASASSDLNDTVHPTNPELRTLDLVTTDHPRMREAMAGGVTTVLYIPGSGSNTGGFGTLTKTHGEPEEALVRFPGSLKIAQAGNPERGAGDLGSGYIGMNQGIRFMLERGQRYYQAWEDHYAGKAPKPELEPDLEYLRGLFRHEYPVTVHTQAYQVVLETLRQLRTEFGLWTVIDHGTFDAYRLSEDSFVRGVPVCNGPRQYYFNRRTGQFVGLADAWYRGGDHGWQKPVRGLGRDGIAINTDSPVVPQEQLTVQCAVSVRLGLPWEIGIRAITINPAVFIGAEHRIGSLTPGKDADLAVWSGDPLDPRSNVAITVVNGRIAYRRDKDQPLF